MLMCVMATLRSADILICLLFVLGALLEEHSILASQTSDGTILWFLAVQALGVDAHLLPLYYPTSVEKCKQSFFMFLYLYLFQADHLGSCSPWLIISSYDHLTLVSISLSEYIISVDLFSYEMFFKFYMQTLLVGWNNPMVQIK